MKVTFTPIYTSCFGYDIKSTAHDQENEYKWTMDKIGHSVPLMVQADTLQYPAVVSVQPSGRTKYLSQPDSRGYAVKVVVSAAWDGSYAPVVTAYKYQS